MRQLLLFCLALPALSQAMELMQPETPVLPQAPLTETIWQQKVAPATEYDLVGLHRYRNTEVEQVASLLFLPGTNMNGVLSILDERHNLWLFLANRGVTVYAMDYRTHFVSHEVKAVDFMKSWTMAAFVDDAARLAGDIKALDADLPLFVAGFSRGVSYAYALAGKVEFAGLIALDGSFKRADPTGFDLASALQQFDSRADYASVLSRRGFEARYELMSSVIDDPSAPANTDRYESIGEELAVTLHKAWGPGALANTEDGLTPVRVLAQQMLDYDWYFPSIQNIEGRSLASHTDDLASDLDDHYGEMSLPIVYFGSSNMGAESILNGVYSAVKSGSPQVALHLLEGYGHVDVLVADRARSEVYEVIDRWIKALIADNK
jgi:hypothetical protein